MQPLARKGFKDVLVSDMPREKMAASGAAALTDAELVAILLRTGTAEKSALKIADEMTADGGLYKRLAGITNLNELLHIKGLGQAKAATVLAALEIGRRIASASPLDKKRIGCPQDAADYLMPRMRYAMREQFVVLLLNSRNRVIGVESVAEGTLTGAVVQPRDVFKPALLSHAASILVAHNHPSGDPQPSDEDKEITRKLVKSGEMLGIPLLDHVIIGDGFYYSFQEYDAL